MKKLLALTLALLMTAALLPLNLKTAVAEDETSGQCGDNLYWSFADGKLTITGSGDMWDYGQGSSDRAPWYTYYGQITTVELPSGLTRIGDNAFYNCVSLRKITIPEGVTAIGAYAFMYCPLKENLVLPESLTSIGEHAFDAADIWYVTVPAAVSSIGDGAFSDCINLREIKTDADNPYFTAVDGVLFNKDKTELITYPAGLQQSSYSVPDGVRTIRPYACGCAPFTTLTFADTVAEIGEWAFFGCNSLKKVTFGNGVTTIGINAFRSCASLETVFISRSVASIHTGAFPACGRLTAFTVDAYNPNFASDDGVILSKDRTRIVLFPTGKDGHYEVPDGVSCIGERAFYWNCTMSKLTSIYLPLSVTRVEYEAFGMGTPLNDVYYEGSQTDRQTLLTIEDHNTRLLNAAWHYDSAGSDPGLSGQCGDKLYWSFDEETGVLTITGSGAMYDYSIGTAPWDSVRSEITAVVFPDGMTSVGKSAFYGCTGIEEIVIPDSVTVINDGAFRGCKGVTSITVPCSVKVVSTNYTFSDCTAVTTVHMTKGTGTMAAGPLPYISGTGSVSVILDDGVRNISDNAFGSPYIAEITIPSSVTSIGSKAFSDCSGLTEITIPSGVTEIGSSAFCNCSGLTEITIPSSVTSIGWGAFSGCTGLASVAIPSSVTCIADHMFYGCTGLPSVTIPSGVTSIGESAFEGCTGLKSVTIPSGVMNIEDSAFKECTGLPSIVIPDSVTSVGMQAFDSCSALKNVTMPCSAEIELSAFDDSTAIRKLRFTVGTGEWKISNKTSSPLFQGKNMTAVLDEGIPEIGEYGFYRCSGLTSITIPSSVTSIGDRAFYACTGLPEITILSHVTSIGKEAFRGCTGLRSASIDSGVIGESAFQECTGIESLTIGDAAESIGASAFYGCTQLTSVEIGGGVTGIGNSAFGNCRALPAITIPDSVTSIGESAFYGCVQLASATIGDGVTDIGKNAFKECASLASITMPCSANIGQSAFSGCKAVTEVHLTKGTGTMTGYKPNTYEYTPWYVSRSNAMTVTLDEGILNIGSWVFYNCTGLTEITLPSSLISIDSYAFFDCKGLTEIVIPGSVTDVGTSAFSGCSNITSVTMPNSVKNIESGAFSGCTYLTDVYYDGTPQMRRKITIQHSNTNLLDAEWHYLPLNAIEWKTLPKKLVYAEGDTLSIYGGAITTYYDHDVVEEEPLTADMVTGFDSSVLGKQTLTVTFGGKTLTYEIEVIAQIQIEGTVEWNAEDVQFKGTTPYVIANGSAQTPRFTVKNSADGSVVDPAYYDYEYRENTNAGTGYVIVTFKGLYSGTAQGWFKIYLQPTTTTTVENVSNGIKLTWSAVPGAAGYVIYRRAWSSTTNGWTDFVRWYNVTGTEWIDGSDVDHKVYAGSRYQYGVKAYFARRTDPVSGALIGGNVGDNFNLGEVGPLKTTVRITTRTLNSVTAGTKQMTVKWSPSKNFTGYQIKYATDANFTKNVKAIKITDWSTAEKIITGLTRGTTYYVTVRSYHEFNGMTYFGEWSNVMSCKVK